MLHAKKRHDTAHAACDVRRSACKPLREPTLRSVETDLKREAAYNLSKMYMVAGNSQLAREVLMAHCRI